MSFIERLWYQGHKAYWLLLPLAWLYGVITALRRALFRLGIKQQVKVNAPVIVVGNISIGGTGKTPFTLLLCQTLRNQGWTPGIVSRGYGANIKAPVLVQTDAAAAEVGDEPLLLAQRSGCPVVVCPDRVAAAEYLLANTKVDIIVSDDGLQHYRLARDAEIVLIDGSRGLGNGQLLPAGPLREGTWRLKQANLVVANSLPYAQADGVMQLKAATAKALCSEATLTPGPVTLIAGIGNPQRFERTALAAGFTVTARHYFADHHKFSAADFSDIQGPLLMTEKDAVKCRDFARADWFSLGVDAALDNSLQQKLDTLLTNLRSSYGT
ncbi:tetraacyldisaccharide 4'-kinase [Rheinheimera sp. EpRS3]|uniref:tetraacyldisaccharide 4'-kinase n=1 Tax=Rheinheimera sp. EpRS3 TaxID=1712383 RepID=UPI0007494E91|nr:tetraacyldisaccharide 4'-kinase [Rheinheimera sp. EpRS3]KUM53663.1 tetraacyldisaccharide 4'-kinase [Rheinheimera sp. EpRS3]